MNYLYDNNPVGNWYFPMPSVNDRGTDHKNDQLLECPVTITDNKETCSTIAEFFKSRTMDSKHQDLDYWSNMNSRKENYRHYVILGGFYLNSAIKYSGYIVIDADYRKNLSERDNVSLVLPVEDYISGDIADSFRKAGILNLNPDIPKRKLNSYLQEALRIKMTDGGEIPTSPGFNNWSGRLVFAAAEFYEDHKLPVVNARHFETHCDRDLFIIGSRFVNVAQKHTDQNLFLVLTLLRISAFAASILAENGIRSSKMILIKGTSSKLMKYFQIYDRGYTVQKARNINVKNAEFLQYFNELRDDILPMQEQSYDSDYKKQLGVENLHQLEELMKETLVLPVVFSERLSQEAAAGKSFIIDGNGLDTSLPDCEVTECLYDFDRKIVNRICSEPEDFIRQINDEAMKMRDDYMPENVQDETDREFLIMLLCLLSVVLNQYDPHMDCFEKNTMRQYLESLVEASEKGTCGGNQVNEFELILNQKILNGELDLLVHHPLSKEVRSRSSIPPIFINESYLYITTPAFELIANQMQLSPNACSVRKSLDEAGLLKPSDELQVKVGLYDESYNGKCRVTAVRRTILSDKSLGKLQGGVSNYHCCSDADGSRIAIGTDERGRTVYISPNHPDLKNQHIQVIGDSGSGKSTAANMIARKKYEQGANLIFVDYSNSNAKDKMISHGFDETFYEFHVREFRVTQETDRDTLQLYLWEMRDQRFILIFRFSRYGDHVEEFLRMLYDLVTEDEAMSVTLVIDEIHELNYEKGSALCHIMEKGRGNGLALISILQAPHELKSMQLSRLNQASVKLIFGLNDRSDADVCLKKMSLKPLSKFSETISDLKRRECMLVGELEDIDGAISPKRYIQAKIPFLE